MCGCIQIDPANPYCVYKHNVNNLSVFIFGDRDYFPIGFG